MGAALYSCDPESSSSGSAPPPRFTLTQKADNTYTLTIGEGVKTIAKGEFSAEESVSITLGKKLALNTRLKGLSEHAVTTIVLPSTLTSIEDYAFYNHRSVRGVLTIPKKVRTIGAYAFTHIGINTPLPYLNVVFAEKSELKTIGDSAFGGSRLKNILLPKQLETIRIAAFNTVALNDGSSFTIPANLKTIENAAFMRTTFRNATLTIESPDITLGEQLFVLSSTEGPFTTVKLPKALYDRYTKTELANRFGRVTAYKKPDDTDHTPKP